MKPLLIRFLVRRLSTRRLAAITVDILADTLERLPRADRVPFLRDLAQEHLGGILRGFESSERAQLMNALLPLVAREFPLAELNLLDAFPNVASDAHGDE